MIIAAFIALAFGTWRIGRRTLFFLHLMQLEGYQARGYFRWLMGHIGDAVVRNSHRAGFLWLLVIWSLGSLLPDSMLPVIWLLWAATFASSRRYRRDRPKKPLVLTPRARRLLALSVLLLLALPAGAAPYVTSVSDWSSMGLILLSLYAADLLAPLAILMSTSLLTPVEKRFRERFKHQARRKLARMDTLEIVAITGSYGKTSVKFAVRQILAHRFSVLATPGSFNTPMGICRVINDDLHQSHRILVLEMGIRHPGDIDELTAIAPPDIALITSVGIAHLESMRSIDAIAKEKARLLAALPPSGCAVLNGDDPRVVEMRPAFSGRSWVVSTDVNTKADIRADNIVYDGQGAHFDVIDESGDRVTFDTKLLGKHNILNILMAIAVGRIHNLRLRQMRHAIANLKSVPHRLEIRSEQGVTVLDDAFNSNPVGARNAVEILGDFRSGRRIIVTPGMIELGDAEDNENRLFGGHIAKHADLAILVGPTRTRPIADGLRDAGFPEKQIVTVQSLFEARDYLASRIKSGDTVLYENDLPDQFNETAQNG